MLQRGGYQNITNVTQSRRERNFLNEECTERERLPTFILTITDRQKRIATVRTTASQFLLASEARMLKLKIFETCEDNRGAGDNINNVSE